MATRKGWRNEETRLFVKHTEDLNKERAMTLAAAARTVKGAGAAIVREALEDGLEAIPDSDFLHDVVIQFFARVDAAQVGRHYRQDIEITGRRRRTRKATKRKKPARRRK